MSVGNFQFQRLEALKLNKKDVTVAYTVKTGRSTDGFVIDNPVDVTIGTASYTVTVSDGAAMGQEVLLVCSARTSGTVTISVSHAVGGDPKTYTMDAADEALLLRWTGTEWAPVYATVT